MLIAHERGLVIDDNFTEVDCSRRSSAAAPTSAGSRPGKTLALTIPSSFAASLSALVFSIALPFLRPIEARQRRDTVE
jgi:hypothetical protein